MTLTRLRRRRRRFAFYSLTRGADADRLERPARRRMAPRRQGDPDRLAGRRLRRLRGHAAGVRARPDAPRRLAGRPGDGLVRLARRSSAALAFYALNLARPLLRQALSRRRGQPASTASPSATARSSLVAVLAFRMGWTPVALLRGCAAGATRRWSRAARTTTSSRPGSSPSLVSAWILPGLPPADARAVLGADAGRRAPVARGGRDRRLHGVRASG